MPWNSTTPSVSVPATPPGTLLFGILGLAPGNPTVTPSPGQTSLWNLASGATVPITRTAAAIKDSPGAATSLGWTLSAAQPWSAAAFVVPVLTRVIPDAVGGTAPSPAWLNALDYSGIQAAIDALPDDGGVVFVPAGNHLQPPEGVLIAKDNVTLLGEGTENSLIAGNPIPTNHVVRVTGGNCSLRNLVIGGPGAGESEEDNFACLYLSGAGVENCVLENVRMAGARTHGLWMQDVASVVGVNLESGGNQKNGLYIQRTGSVPCRVLLVNSEFSQNLERGVVIECPVDNVSPADQVLLVACSMESNWRETNGEVGYKDGIGVRISHMRGVGILGAYFEHKAEQGTDMPVQFSFIRVVTHLESGRAVTAEGAVIDGCFFNGNDRVRWGAEIGGPLARFTNNVGINLKDGLFPPDPLAGTGLVMFAEKATDGIESGNLDLDAVFYAVPPRIVFGPGVLGLSKGAVEVFRHAEDPDVTGLRSGALFWRESGGGALRLLTQDQQNPLKTLTLQDWGG